jgi:hypothetical protein
MVSAVFAIASYSARVPLLSNADRSQPLREQKPM